jgi:hypothetical protein
MTGTTDRTRTTDRRPRGQSRPPRYRSLSSFYTADPRRVRSRELDVGLWWRENADGPLHRAAWVSDTGELYLVRLGPSQHGGGEVEVLGTVADRAQLESVLEGWREQCGGPRSLTWLRERADRLGERIRVTQVRLRRSASADSAEARRLGWTPTMAPTPRTVGTGV